MKKAADHPDMFSTVAPAKKEKPKAAPVVSNDMQTATVCGLISGIPQGLANALKSLEEIERRCADSVAMAGILTPSRAKKLNGIAGEIRAMLPELHRIRKDVDGMVSESVHGKAAPDSGLF